MKPPALRAPVVLAHGLLGFAKIGIGDFTLVSYFRHIPEFLESGGNVVHAASVPPTGSIERRAESLKKAVRDRFGSDPVHVLAHSMGGLDARHMITHLEMAGQVLSLTTLGTPHRGTTLADRGTAFARRARVFELLRFLGVPDDAFHDLCTERLAAFNAATPDAPGVRYFSVAGSKDRDQVFFPLRWCHDIVAPVEGANDGMVSVRSASWGESLSVWDCDHFNLVGWTGPREQLAGFTFDVERGYREVLEKLAQAGF